MNVIEFSKSLESANLPIKWPSIYADAIYDFTVPRLPGGASLDVGTHLHCCIEKFINGQPVPDAYGDVCAVIIEVLFDQGIELFEPEEPVAGCGMNGRIDVHGLDVRGHDWVIELKASKGRYILPPSPREIYQMVSYAILLDRPTPPRLMCVRVNLSTAKIGLYKMYDYPEWLRGIRARLAA